MADEQKLPTREEIHEMFRHNSFGWSVLLESGSVLTTEGVLTRDECIPPDA